MDTITPQVNNSDYVAYRIQTIEFARCSRSACAPRRITFVNNPYDVEVENVETFDLLLTSNFPRVRPDPFIAEVIIHDDSESELALITTLFGHGNYLCKILFSKLWNPLFTTLQQLICHILLRDLELQSLRDPISYAEAYIRLEQRTFTVTEGVDAAVNICAEIYDPTPDRSSCPVVFHFDINLSVHGGTLSVITLNFIE